MKKATLPVEKAIEPNEGAREPQMPASQNSLSQNSSILTPLEALSQPGPKLSHRERLEWLQARRRPGLWAQCDACARWRYLPSVREPHDLPPTWFCRLNPDPTFADCSVPEKQIRVRQEEDLIHGKFAAGSVVWARMPGYPWWPAMVCDCPDTEQYYWLDGFSDIPTHYNVVFLDEADVTRAWIAADQIKPYVVGQKKEFKVSPKMDKKYKGRINTAIKLAEDAKSLDLAERLSKYSFIAQYKGPINSPIDNKKEIKKQQIILKKKLQLNENDSDSDYETSEKRMKKEGVKIILGSLSPDKRARLAKNKEKGNSKTKDKTLKSPAIQDKKSVAPGKHQSDGNKKNVSITETEASTESSETEKHYLAKGDSDSVAMKKTLKVKFFEEHVLGVGTHDTNTESKEKDNETFSKNTSTESSDMKQPTSLAVQVGSKDSVIQNSWLEEESLDNDTSKTYVPGPESTETTQNTAPDSPGSDDFEY